MSREEDGNATETPGGDGEETEVPKQDVDDDFDEFGQFRMDEF